MNTFRCRASIIFIIKGLHKHILCNMKVEDEKLDIYIMIY